MAKRTRPAARHRHTCESCAYPWDCLQGVKCQVATAAKVNGQGPYCDLCMHLTMAIHAAQARGWRYVAADIVRVRAGYRIPGAPVRDPD